MDKLSIDLFKAYDAARRNKRNTHNQLRFELQYEQELLLLHEEISERRWKPKRSIAFVVDKPVKREIFAAHFRDRVVHHLLFAYLNPIVEKYLIYDCYSCRKGKGTSKGIQRVSSFVRGCSANYTQDCYILKLDLKAYFRSINRNLLYQQITRLLQKEYQKRETLRKPIPFNRELVDYLLKTIIFNEPIENCMIKGSSANWNGLPRAKSLFYAELDCGLPIGNITSQLFGNIYLMEFDHWIKRNMGFRYYGRYVDDFVILHPDKKVLTQAMSDVSLYLKDQLGLEVHPNKIYLQHYSKGVSFLGAIIKPNRMYAGKRITAAFKSAIQETNKQNKKDMKILRRNVQQINSYLGLLKQYQSYKIRRKMLFQIDESCLKSMFIEKRFSMLRLRKKFDMRAGLTRSTLIAR